MVYGIACSPFPSPHPRCVIWESNGASRRSDGWHRGAKLNQVTFRIRVYSTFRRKNDRTRCHFSPLTYICNCAMMMATEISVKYCNADSSRDPTGLLRIRTYRVCPNSFARSMPFFAAVCACQSLVCGLCAFPRPAPPRFFARRDGAGSATGDSNGWHHPVVHVGEHVSDAPRQVAYHR